MEDPYKDDPNSWLRRARFSKTIYHQPDHSQIPIMPLDELKLWHFDLNSKLAVTSMPVTLDNAAKANQSNTMPALNLNADGSLTSEVPDGSDSETNIAETVSKNKTLSDMLKVVKNTVRRKFVGPSSGDGMEAKTAKSSSRQKKESRRLKKYFDRVVCQVSILEKSSEDH